MDPGFDLSRAPFYPTWQFNRRRRSSTPAVRWIVLLSFQCHVYFILHTRVQFARGVKRTHLKCQPVHSVPPPTPGDWSGWVAEELFSSGKKGNLKCQRKNIFFSQGGCCLCVCVLQWQRNEQSWISNKHNAISRGWEPSSSSQSKVNWCTPVRVGWLWGDIWLEAFKLHYY